jgi:hypothetical protein
MAARYPRLVSRFRSSRVLGSIAGLRISESKETGNVLTSYGFGSEARIPGRGQNAADACTAILSGTPPSPGPPLGLSLSTLRAYIREAGASRLWR